MNLAALSKFLANFVQIDLMLPPRTQDVKARLFDSIRRKVSHLLAFPPFVLVFPFTPKGRPFSNRAGWAGKEMSPTARLPL